MKTLRDHRIEAGMTQEELSQQAGIRVATISSLENGRSKPRENTLGKLSSALNVDIGDLRLSVQNTEQFQQTMIDQIQGDWSFLDGLDRDLRTGLAQSLVAEWTHSSTAIEGNTLTAGDTLFILTEGLTVSGKSLREHQEIYGHAEALTVLSSWVKNKKPLRIASLHQLHRAVQTDSVMDIYSPISSWKIEPNGTMIMPASGKSKWHEYASPKDVPILIDTWLKALARSLRVFQIKGKSHSDESKIESLVSVYTDLHLGFVGIHPYADGNGRLARLLANIPLLRAGMPPLLISLEQRRNYIELLGEYRLDEGTIAPGQDLVKKGKKRDALCQFFRSQWQVTLDHVADFQSRQEERSS